MKKWKLFKPYNQGTLSGKCPFTIALLFFTANSEIQESDFRHGITLYVQCLFGLSFFIPNWNHLIFGRIMVDIAIMDLQTGQYTYIY